MPKSPDAPETADAGPGPAPGRWTLALGGLVSAGLLGAIGWQLSRTSPATLAMLAHLPPAVFASFAALYLTQPLADFAIYRRVWGLPLSGLAALVRKTAINEAVLGYGGELYLYLWARRRADLANPPFAAIKDVNILSSILGFAFTLAALLAAAALADNPDLVRLLEPVTWPAIGVMAVGLGVLIFARRVFSLNARDIAWVAAIHAARLVAWCGFTILTWALALPEVTLDVWIVLLAVTLVGARIPFLTNKTLVVGNVVLLMLGAGSSFAVLLAATAVATLAAHLVVIAVLGALDLRRAAFAEPAAARPSLERES